MSRSSTCSLKGAYHGLAVCSTPHGLRCAQYWWVSSWCTSRWVLQPLVEGEVPELGSVSSHLLGISANRAFKTSVSFLEISSISSLPAPSLPFPCLAPLSLCFSNLGIREGTPAAAKGACCTCLAACPAQGKTRSDGKQAGVECPQSLLLQDKTIANEKCKCRSCPLALSVLQGAFGLEVPFYFF